ADGFDAALHAQGLARRAQHHQGGEHAEKEQPRHQDRTDFLAPNTGKSPDAGYGHRTGDASWPARLLARRPGRRMQAKRMRARKAQSSRTKVTSSVTIQPLMAPPWTSTFWSFTQAPV